MPGLSALDDLDDDALVQRTLDGNNRAFEALVRRYQARVIAICAPIAGDYEQAADLAQEAFVSAYTSLRRYQTGRSFFAWLYRIAVNASLNYRRRKEPSQLPGEAGEQALLSTPDSGPTPDEQLEQAELARQVQEGISQLPPDYAAVLALRYGADLDYEAIADTLNVPVGTVKTRIFRAKAMLRALLEPLREEEAL